VAAGDPETAAGYRCEVRNGGGRASLLVRAEVLCVRQPGR
jgi:hypothetical protein